MSFQQTMMPDAQVPTEPVASGVDGQIVKIWCLRTAGDVLRTHTITATFSRYCATSTFHPNSFFIRSRNWLEATSSP